MSIRHAQGIKPAMLVQCREQIGYSLDDVRKKVPSIAQLEAGKKASHVHTAGHIGGYV